MVSSWDENNVLQQRRIELCQFKSAALMGS